MQQELKPLNPIISGIILIIVGGIFVFAPGLSGSMISIFIGAALLVSGCSSLIAWNNARKVGSANGILVFAIVAILLAAVCLVHPLAVAETLGWLIAGCIVVAGIFRVISTLTTPFIPFSLKVAGIISGAIDIVLGVLAILNPAWIMYFLGAGLLLTGITDIVFGILVKKEGPIDVQAEPSTQTPPRELSE
ncbi:MAG: DUF308 domain-containing protein [Coriobacteriia bacterium]|nr:DUF308 domain-containing protein [Coriobacteriia bacterium]